MSLVQIVKEIQINDFAIYNWYYRLDKLKTCYIDKLTIYIFCMCLSVCAQSLASVVTLNAAKHVIFKQNLAIEATLYWFKVTTLLWNLTILICITPWKLSLNRIKQTTSHNPTKYIYTYSSFGPNYDLVIGWGQSTVCIFGLYIYLVVCEYLQYKNKHILQCWET